MTIRRHRLGPAGYDPYAEMAPQRKCAACGGELILLIDIAHNPQRYDQDHPRTLYYRCDSCRQIQIVEE